MSWGSPRVRMPVRALSDCAIAPCSRRPTGIHGLCTPFVSSWSVKPSTNSEPILIEPKVPRCNLIRSRGLPSGHASSFPDRPVIRRPIFPVPAGMAVLARPDVALLLRGPTAGKDVPLLVPGWLLVGCVCLAAGSAWAVLGVATHSAAHDEIIHVVTVGCTMLMITVIAVALAASGAQTRTVFSS